MKTVKIGIKSQDRASRLELFIRIAWFLVSSIVLSVFGIVAGLCTALHWVYILVTGKRHRGLNSLIRNYVVYRTKVLAYAFMLTEERNPIFPED